MADPRVLRTRAALHRAVAELAATTSVTQLSVTEVAERAGINRVTFYKHFSSPAEALVSMLGEELDTLREQTIRSRLSPETDARETLEASIRAALAHLDAHHEIYRTSVETPNDHVAYELLLEHIIGTVRIFVSALAERAPELTGLDHDLVATFFAHGYTAALFHWLESGRQDEEAVITTVRALLPPWWFTQQA